MDKKQLRFVTLLKRYPVLLSKSQLPEVKSRKTVAIEAFSIECASQLGLNINNLGLFKKIHNLKRSVRNKASAIKRSDETISLKPYEKLMLDLIEDVSIGKNCVAANNTGDNLTQSLNMKQEDVAVDVWMLPQAIQQRRRAPSSVADDDSDHHEPVDVRGLSTEQLQRLVLIEKLKLIRLQTKQLMERGQP